MPSNLACVGLLEPDGSDLDEAGFAALCDRLWRVAEPVGTARDGVLVRRWTDASGASLTMEVDGRSLLGATPSFRGSPGVNLTGLHMLNRDTTYAAVVDDDGEQLSALALELEERHFLPGASGERAGPDEPVRASVVALGQKMNAFADRDAYAASEWATLGDDGDGPGWAAEAFVSFGVWGEPDTAEAYARLGGPVLEVSERVNGLTGHRFTAARVSTCGFEVDVCLPPSWSEPLQVGSLLVGNGFLVGSIADLVPDAPAPVERTGDETEQPRRRWWRRG